MRTLRSSAQKNTNLYRRYDSEKYHTTDAHCRNARIYTRTRAMTFQMNPRSTSAREKYESHENIPL